MKKNRYSELSKDAVYLLSRSEFEKQKIITTEYAVKVLGNYLKATRLLDNLTKRNRLIQLKRGRYLHCPKTYFPNLTHPIFFCIQNSDFLRNLFCKTPIVIH